MKKWLAIIGFGLIVFVMLIGFALSQLESQPQPQKTAAPSSEITRTLSPTFTLIPSETPTRYPSSTPTASHTPTLTNTATLATRVIELAVIMPDVTLPPSVTPLPTNLVILPAAPEPLEPLPNATFLPHPYTDFTDWISYESDHPLVQYIVGTWAPLLSQQASEGQYHYTEDSDAQVRFAFEGEGVRVRYVGFTNGGRWQVWLDGEMVDTIDAYSPLGKFTGTEVYTVDAGEHVLELHNLEEANPASTGHLLALDAIQVYRPDALTLIFPNGIYPSDTPTATLIPAQKIELGLGNRKAGIIHQGNARVKKKITRRKLPRKNNLGARVCRV